MAISAGLLGACLYGLQPLVWEYTIGAEVFALNNCLCACLLWLTAVAVYHSQRKSTQANSGRLYWAIVLGALVSGLLLANQHASSLLVVILVPFVLLWTCRVVMSWKFLLITALSFVVGGVLPYMYLVIASLRPKPGSWGDMTTFSGLLRHVLRSEYGTLQLGLIQGEEGLWTRIWLYLVFTDYETMHIGLLFASLGLFAAVFAWPKTASASSSVTECKNMSSSMTTTSHDESPSIACTPDKKKDKSKPKTKHHHHQQQPQLHHADGHASSPAPAPAPASESLGSLRALVVCFAVCWLFYILFWHGVLSNLPLSAPMPFAVHSR